MDTADFERLPVMGILRGIREDQVIPVSRAMMDAGLKTAEIAMNTDRAPLLIRKMKKYCGRDLTVGAGTVVTREKLDDALKAGATFAVLPVFLKDIVEFCVKRSVPVFPGALTPGEIFSAWRAKAYMVKVFPAKSVGPGYFKEISGPMPEIKLLACSGVTPANVKDYFSNGASAVAFGSSVFKKDILEKGDFEKIKGAVADMVNAVKMEIS
jgi:2-dehydro-3-deoxyphosphogluconate aldolase/(4S)-4-hydroxy-2-oxoglutarate aldolase